MLKIMKHCKENLPELVTGQLLGLDFDSTLEVTNCFPFPSKIGEDDDDGDGGNLGGAEYQIEMMRCLREVNVDNNTVGWYVTEIRFVIFSCSFHLRVSNLRGMSAPLTWVRL